MQNHVKTSYIRIGRPPLGIVRDKDGWTLDDNLKIIIVEIIGLHYIRQYPSDIIGIQIRHGRTGNPYHSSISKKKVENILDNLSFYFGYAKNNDSYVPLYYLSNCINLSYIEKTIQERADYEKIVNILEESGLPLHEIIYIKDSQPKVVDYIKKSRSKVVDSKKVMKLNAKVASHKKKSRSKVVDSKEEMKLKRCFDFEIPPIFMKEDATSIPVPGRRALMSALQALQDNDQKSG